MPVRSISWTNSNDSGLRRSKSFRCASAPANGIGFQTLSCTSKSACSKSFSVRVFNLKCNFSVARFRLSIVYRWSTNRRICRTGKHQGSQEQYSNNLPGKLFFTGLSKQKGPPYSVPQPQQTRPGSLEPTLEIEGSNSILSSRFPNFWLAVFYFVGGERGIGALRRSPLTSLLPNRTDS